MQRISRHMPVYWKELFASAALLWIACYLAVQIAGISGALHETGTMQNGIEFGVAESISASGWQWAELYMSDAEQTAWNHAYERLEDGRYHLRNTVVSREQLEELEEQFMAAQACVWKISQMSEEAFAEFLLENGELGEYDYLAIRDCMEGMLTEEDQETASMAFVKSQSEAAGLDLKQTQFQYIIFSILKILLCGAVIAVCLAGSCYIILYTQQTIRRRIEEPEIAFAEQQLFQVICSVFTCIGLMWSGFSGLFSEGAGRAEYGIAGAGILAAGAFALCLRKLPVLEPLQLKIDKRRRIKFKWLPMLRNGSAACLAAAAVVAALIGYVSKTAVFVFWILDGAILLSVCGYLLADIAQAADCVQNIQVEDESEWRGV